MKKIERAVKTDRFEAVLVYWEPESEDFYPGPGGAATPTVQESYLLIGPPGGQLARIEGVDASIVMLLLQTTMLGGHTCGRMVRSPGGM